MELINALAENYAAKYSSPIEPVLQAVYEETVANHPHAHMISSPVQGKFLEIISSILQPTYILEIGSFTGFSAMCLAKGLSPAGQLHTIELRNEDANTALINFKRAGLQEKIHLHTGNAKEIIPQLTHEWDLIFIDADKTGYIEYYEMVFPRLKAGGIILADNVLFHGEVLETKIKGKNAQAIEAFNRHVSEDTRVEHVLVTLRDGLQIIKKKNV